MKPRFSAIFYPRKSEVNKNGKVTIMGKITINGERVQFSTKLLIDPGNWDSPAGRAKSRSEEGKNVNRLLDNMRKTINDLYFKQIEEYGFASPEKIKHWKRQSNHFARFFIISMHNTHKNPNFAYKF